MAVTPCFWWECASATFIIQEVKLASRDRHVSAVASWSAIITKKSMTALSPTSHPIENLWCTTDVSLIQSTWFGTNDEFMQVYFVIYKLYFLLCQVNLYWSWEYVKLLKTCQEYFFLICKYKLLSSLCILCIYFEDIIHINVLCFIFYFKNFAKFSCWYLGFFFYSKITE